MGEPNRMGNTNSEFWEREIIRLTQSIQSLSERMNKVEDYARFLETEIKKLKSPKHISSSYDLSQRDVKSR